MFDLHVLWENSRLQKPWKLLQKPFETPTKTIKSMQFPKKLGHIGFWLCFILVMPQNWKSWAFCFLFFFGGGIVLMAMMASLKTVCASPCRWGCTTCFVAIWSGFFRDPAQCRANQVHDQFLERPKHLWISVQKSRTLGSATNSWFFEGLGPQV